MKKKIIITLAIFFGIAILVVFCLFQYLNKNQLLENTTYTPQDRVNHNFHLKLDSHIPTTVIFDTTNNFRTDGELYFIVDYSTYSDDKIEQELALTTFSKKTDSSIEIFDVESKDTNPPMTRCYKVSYNKQDSRYYVLSTSEENFDKSDDENTSCVIVDANNKIVGLAN